MQEELRRVIETLRRQRVRQEDFLPVLDCVVEQAGRLYELAPSGPIQAEARRMRARALELQRIARLEALTMNRGTPHER